MTAHGFRGALRGVVSSFGLLSSGGAASSAEEEAAVVEVSSTAAGVAGVAMTAAALGVVDPTGRRRCHARASRSSATSA